MLIDVCCAGIIVPLVCVLGHLAAVLDNLTGHSSMASPPLGTIVRDIWIPLDEA